MYTAADIRNMDFGKKMGGYKAEEVDTFLDSCADTVQALINERDELNKKMGILAAKLKEYREDEDSLRSALLTAQRMGDATLRSAKDEAQKIIASAREEAKKEVMAVQDEVRAQEAELERVKKEVSEFKATILALYKDHLALLKNVPEVKVTNAPVQEVPAASASYVQEETPVTVTPVKDETIVEPVQEAVAPVAVPVVEERPRSKFANLKFGEDYSLDDDEDAND